MAIKISNTTVINDSRELENISNLKTINGQSILGSGDLAVGGGAVAKSGDTMTGDLTLASNLNFSGNARRITGDFSNATATNRVAFQSSTVNSQTAVLAIPNGTSTTAQWQAYNNSDPTNSNFLGLAAVGSTDVRITSGIVGTNSFLPMTFYTGGSERVRIDTSGNVGIGTNAPTDRLDVNGTFRVRGNRIFQDNSGGNAFEIGPSAGTGDSTVWGFVAPAARSIAWFTNVTERLRIDSAGNVLVTNNAGLGYGTGAGGTVTQASSKSTSVTLNRPSGLITMNNAALGAGASVVFQVFNTTCLIGDAVSASSVDDFGQNYTAEVLSVWNGHFFIRVTNITGGSLSQAARVAFNVHKGATS